MNKIGSEAFRDCLSLTDVFIPDGVSVLEENSFNYCPSLKTISLPSSLKKIDYRALYRTGLVSILYSGSSTAWEQIQIDTSNDSYLQGVSVIFNVKKILVLPENIRKVESEAFEGIDCQVVIVPDGCKSIGSKAFANCKRLKQVVLSETTEVASDAFENCNNVVMVFR